MCQVILIVNNEPEVRDALRMTLVLSGTHVFEAKDLDTAMFVVNNLDINLDVVVCNYRLGKTLTGKEVIAAVSKVFPNSATILLTGDVNI